MPTTTYTPIATITLTGTDSQIDFANIPSTYRDLVLVADWTAVSNTVQGSINFNNDSSAIYNLVAMYATTSAQSFSQANQTTDLSMFPRTTRGSFIMQIIDYAQTDKHKTYLIRTGVSDYAVWASAGRYATTSAISSIRLTPTANFASSSTFSLYGIAG